MSIELRDELILPCGGTQAATLAQSYFKRKISQLNPLGFMIKINERKLSPLWVALCLQHAWPVMVLVRFYGSCQRKMYPNGKGKRSVQNMIYPLEPEIQICIDLHLPFYLYDLAFSKHLRTYSLNMPVLCLSNPFMHSSLCIPNTSLMNINIS